MKLLSGLKLRMLFSGFSLKFIVIANLLRLIRFFQSIGDISATSFIFCCCVIYFLPWFLILWYSDLWKGIWVLLVDSKSNVFSIELTLRRVKARPINDLAEANDTFGRIFAALLLLSQIILLMNFIALPVMNALFFSLLSPPPSPPSIFFSLAPLFARPEFRSPRTGTLTKQSRK